jgi:polyhydroxyalkanoate synthesis repressor PhaR
MVETKTEDANAAAERPRRIIKRYSNRKLYDTKDSRYVTLLQIAEMVRAGEEVQIIDNNTKDDLTEVTLAQIIYEEQKAQTRSVPLQTLKELIHQRTERVLSDLRESPIGRLIPGTKTDAEGGTEGEGTAKADSPAPVKQSFVEHAKETLEDVQQRLDEQIRNILPNLIPWQQLQQEVKRLTSRVEELEGKLGLGHAASSAASDAREGKEGKESKEAKEPVSHKASASHKH